MIRSLIIALLLAAAAAPCLADGDCNHFRPATAAEQQAYAAMRATVSGAAPAAPKDWLRTDQLDLQAGDVIPDCTGLSATAPLRYRFRFDYAWDKRIGEATAQAVGTSMALGTAGQQAKRQELEMQLDAGREARKQARRAGNTAEYERIDAQMKALRAEQSALDEQVSQALMGQMQSGEWAAAMSAGTPQRQEATVTVHVNADVAWVPEDAQPVTVAGAREAWWRPGDMGSLVILVGPWDAKTHRASLGAAAQVTQARTVAIEIQAERAMAEAMAAGMDVAAMAGAVR
jgi:hypothetical protein